MRNLHDLTYRIRLTNVCFSSQGDRVHRVKGTWSFCARAPSPEYFWRRERISESDTICRVEYDWNGIA